MPQVVLKSFCKETMPGADSIDRILEHRGWQLKVKRFLDVVLSLAGLLFLLPLFLWVAIFIKLDSKGPVFFAQRRVGKHGKQFSMMKFRTMIADAEQIGRKITICGDCRITKVGHVLRKYKVDELPQLVNVLLGDMSLVGPRPEVPQYVKLYDEQQKSILKVRPGITDPASIAYRHESAILAQSKEPEKMYMEEVLPRKIALSLGYLQNISVLYDLKLILLTLCCLIKRQ